MSHHHVAPQPLERGEPPQADAELPLRPALDSTLYELPSHAVEIRWGSPLSDLCRRLREQPGVPGALVRREGAAMGVVTRPVALAGEAHRAVEPQVTPLEHLLTVPPELPLPVAARRALLHGDLSLPLLVQADDGLRLLDARVLLGAYLEVLEAGNRDKQALLGEVARYAAALEVTLDEQRHARDGLANAGRAETIGQLVAGVAHEVNTPVGICLTAVTHLQEKSAGLRRRFDAGELRRTDMQRFLELCDESSQLIFSNLTRAAELVKSFKQVAADQAHTRRRPFNLRDYLHDIIWSLRPRFAATEHRLAIDCADEIVLDSYPGALWQVVTNLVINSQVHGFGTAPGTIEVRVDRVGPDHIELLYGDDGRGIPGEHLGKVFEPFFTTRHDQGSSGLGLHIVFNLVTGPLGGSIEVRPNRPRGTLFVLRLPLVAPSAPSGNENNEWAIAREKRNITE